MCGRYAIHSPEKAIAEFFKVARSEPFIKRYNVAPSTDVPVIRLVEGETELVNCHWGLIPHWARDRKLQPINARGNNQRETIFQIHL